MSVQPNKLIPKRHNNPLGQALAGKLTKFAASVQPLSGIQNPDNLDCLVKQLLDSIRRVEFVKSIANKPVDPVSADPSSDRFDPLKAAVLRMKEGNRDDAVWLVFLAVHFGKHSKDGYTLARHVYGRYGENGLWDWQSVSADPADFRRWLHAQNATLKPFRFSNHRKYEGLDAFSKRNRIDH